MLLSEFSILQWHFFVGPELTSMVAFLAALPILILAAKKEFLMPKEVMTFDGVENGATKAGFQRKPSASHKIKVCRLLKHGCHT